MLTERGYRPHDRFLPGCLDGREQRVDVSAGRQDRAPAPAGAQFPAQLTVYDSLGEPHVATITYTETAPNTWSYSVALPAADFASGVSTPITGTLAFNSDGTLTTVTPITRNQCRIDVVAAWNLFGWLPFGPELLKFVFAKFVEQDRRTMELQAEGLKHNPHLMLIDDADRPAKWYFQLKAAHLEAKRAGGAMKHPMSGPVTLKWRS